MVKLLLGLDQPPTPHDVADALAVALCHLQSSTGAIADRDVAPDAVKPQSHAAVAGASIDRDRITARFVDRKASEPRRRGRWWRRLRRAGAAVDVLWAWRAGRDGGAADPHARARGSDCALRLQHAARAGSVRAADRDQRHRSEARPGGAVRHRAGRFDPRDPHAGCGAVDEDSRRRQEDRRADWPGAEGSAAGAGDASGRLGRRRAAGRKTSCATTCSRRWSISATSRLPRRRPSTAPQGVAGRGLRAGAP